MVLRCLYLLCLLALLSSCSFNKQFYPTYYGKNAVVESSKHQFTSFEINCKNNQKLHAVLFQTNKDTAKALVVYFHGNAGSVATYQSVAEGFCASGYDCLLIDYLGYGKSEGKATHLKMLESGRTVASYIKKQQYSMPVILYGFSIGGHLAVTIAKEYQTVFDALVIEVAFTSHKDIAVSRVQRGLKPWAKLLVKNYYPGIKAMPFISIPKLIIHSKEDQVVPFQMGEQYSSVAQSPTLFWPINGRHGYAMRNRTQFFTQMHQLLEAVGPPN